MQLQTKPLKEALAICGSAIKNRSTLPVLFCVRLSAQNGSLTVQSSDINSFVSREVPCEGDLAVTCVNYDTFSRLISHEQSETVELTPGNRLEIKGRSRSAVSVMDAVEFPQPPAPGAPLAVNPVDLADAIESVAWCAKAGDERCADLSVKLEPKLLQAAAFEGRVMAIFQRAIICEERNFGFRAEFADRLVPALREEHSVVSLSNHISVTHKNGFVSAKLSEEIKYDPGQLLAMPRGEEILINIDVLRDCCFYGQALNDNPALKASLLKFEFTGEKLVATSRGGHGEWGEEYPVKSQPVDFFLDADLLVRTIKNMTGPVLKMNVCESGVWFSDGDLMVMVGRNIGW